MQRRRRLLGYMKSAIARGYINGIVTRPGVLKSYDRAASMGGNLTAINPVPNTRTVLLTCMGDWHQDMEEEEGRGRGGKVSGRERESARHVAERVKMLRLLSACHDRVNMLRIVSTCHDMLRIMSWSETEYQTSIDDKAVAVTRVDKPARMHST